MGDLQINMGIAVDGGQAVDQVQKLQKQVEEAKSGFEQLGDVLGDIKGGFTALKGAMELFGIEGEGVQKVLEKLSAALEVTEGIEKVSKLGESFNKLSIFIKESTAFKLLDNAATEAATVVQTTFGVAVDTTTASFKALKLAIVATGIGLLVVGITELIIALNNTTDAGDAAIKKQKEFNEVLKDSADSYKQAYSQIEKLKIEFSQAGDNAGKQKRAMEDYNSTIGDSTKKINTFADGQKFLASNEQTKAYIDAMTARAAATIAVGKAAEVSFKLMEAAQQKKDIDDKLKIAVANAELAAKANNGKVYVDGLTTDLASAITFLTLDAKQKKKEIDDANKDLDQQQKHYIQIATDATSNAEKIAIDHGWGPRTKKSTQEGANGSIQIMQNHYQQLIINSNKEEQLQINRQKKANDRELNIFETQAEFQQKKINILEEYYNEIKDKDAAAAERLRKQIEKEQNILFDNGSKVYFKKRAQTGGVQGEVVKVSQPININLNRQIGIDEVANAKTPQINTGLDELKKQQQQLNDDLLKLNQSSLNKQLEQDKAFYDEKKRIAVGNAELMHKLDLYYLNQKLEVTAGTLGQLSDLFGKQTAAGKATAIAEATINTYLAASKALTGIPKGNPFGAVMAIAQAAIVIATGIKNVKAIISTKVPGQSDGSPTIDASSPSAPLTPTPVQTSTSLNQDQINQIGNAAASRVYVLDSDIQNNRERDARLNRAARLGG